MLDKKSLISVGIIQEGFNIAQEKGQDTQEFIEYMLCELDKAEQGEMQK